MTEVIVQDGEMFIVGDHRQVSQGATAIVQTGTANPRVRMGVNSDFRGRAMA